MLKKASVAATAAAVVFSCVSAVAAVPDFSEQAGMYVDLTYYYADGTTAQETKSQYGLFGTPVLSLGSAGLPSVSVSASGSEFNGSVGEYGLTKVTATTVFWDTYWITGDAGYATARVGSMIEGGFGAATDAGQSSASMGILAGAFDPDAPLPPEALSALYVSKQSSAQDGIPVTSSHVNGVGVYAYNEGTFPSAAEHDFGYLQYDLSLSPDDPLTLLWGSTYTLETTGGSAAAALDYRHMSGAPFELSAGSGVSYADVRSYSKGDRRTSGSPVPEPATITMLGLGLLTLAGIVRKKLI